MYHEHGPEVAEAARSRLHPALAAAMNAERTSPGGPEQVEAERSMLAVHRDPSLTGSDRAERDTVSYPDDDIRAARGADGRWVFVHKDGRRY